MTQRSIFIILIVLFACKQSPSQNFPSYEIDTLPNGDIRYRPDYSLTNQDTSIINLEYFDTLPETINFNAGEFYTFDSSKLSPTNYIFLTNLTEYAIIRINKRHIYLLKDYKNCIAQNDGVFKDVFIGNGFQIIFTHKIIQHQDGVTYENATLEIENSKFKKPISIHGGYKIP